MLLEQRWSKSEDEESTLPGVVLFFLVSLPSINHSRRLVRAWDPRVLVKEIAERCGRSRSEGGKSRRRSSERRQSRQKKKKKCACRGGGVLRWWRYNIAFANQNRGWGEEECGVIKNEKRVRVGCSCNISNCNFNYCCLVV